MYWHKAEIFRKFLYSDGHSNNLITNTIGGVIDDGELCVRARPGLYIGGGVTGCRWSCGGAEGKS